MEAINADIKQIINTHGHFDHIGANKYLKEQTAADLLIHKNETDYLKDPEKNFSAMFLEESIISPPADRLLDGNDIIEINNYSFQVIFTPGHSPGSISLYCQEKGIIFCGDLIFKTGTGRTDIPGSDQALIKKSIETILTLPGETTVYPGHGVKTTIGDFKRDIWGQFN